MATPYKMNTQQQQHVMQQPQEVHQLGPKDERHFSVHLYVPQGDHVPDKYCRRCGRQDTWQWRRGPDGCSSCVLSCFLFLLRAFDPLRSPLFSCSMHYSPSLSPSSHAPTPLAPTLSALSFVRTQHIFFFAASPSVALCLFSCAIKVVLTGIIAISHGHYCGSLCNACGQRYAKMVERENRNCVPYPRQRISVGELIW
eukprot:TRINITY_DN844_c0_g1_i2.p1 TRINITY_DN844_c0_g1~~TRINITY_DN844_c0_g1_i2.p1  ORF type:complete len:198 (-),score=22.89 TRINITY_DN844_c0_g1_i2:238-831(-)